MSSFWAAAPHSRGAVGAISHGVVREDFLKNYLGSELDPLWLETVSKLTAKGWKNFVARDKDRIKELRAQIRLFSEAPKIPIARHPPAERHAVSQRNP